MIPKFMLAVGCPEEYGTWFLIHTGNPAFIFELSNEPFKDVPEQIAVPSPVTPGETIFYARHVLGPVVNNDLIAGIRFALDHNVYVDHEEEAEEDRGQLMKIAAILTDWCKPT
jgi:hypothetical protein